MHVGEKECHDWCREQRLNRARSQVLSEASSGVSVQRQGSVLVTSLCSTVRLWCLRPRLRFFVRPQYLSADHACGQSDTHVWYCTIIIQNAIARRHVAEFYT